MRLGTLMLMLTGPLMGCDRGPSTEGLLELYNTLQHDAQNFGYEDGAWTEDFGDAAAFGPTYYVHAGRQLNKEEYIERAAEAAAYDMRVVNQATSDIFWLTDNLEEVFMAVQGAITWSGVAQDDTAVADIDALLDVMDPIVQTSGNYMNLNLGAFATDLYGPTATTAGVAVIYLQHAHYLQAERSEEWRLRAEEIVSAIDTQAFVDDHYRFNPETETLYLYPNAIMLIALNRLYELTGNPQYLSRAERVYEGIQPLWDERMQFYHSPYSIVSQGAQTSEYSTLSSQNYLLLGLMELYRHTEDTRYRDDVIGLLQSMRMRLYSAEDHFLVHHWVDGRPANANDPDHFCSGCNLQTLFILWYVEHVLGLILE